MNKIIKNDEEDLLKYLLLDGLDPNQTNEEGKTLLIYACENNAHKCIKTLLKHGADINKVDNFNSTPLIKASQMGHIEAVRALLSIPECKIDHVDNNSRSAIFFSAALGREEVTKELLEAGADIEKKDKYGWTPFIISAWNNKLSMVELLASKGAQIDVSDINGDTALHHTCKAGKLEITKLLCSLSLDINNLNKKKITPYQYADEHENIRCYLNKIIKEKRIERTDNLLRKALSDDKPKRIKPKL